MNALSIVACMAGGATVACAQATHNGYIWIEGPDEFLAANTTYTLEVWGRVESPLYVDGQSMIAGFGIDILNTGGGPSVASVSNVRIDDWATNFGTIGIILGNDILGTSGGQLPSWVDPQEPPPPPLNPIRLFTFDFTTASGPLGEIGFSPANPNPNGGFSFYPHMLNGASIIIPNSPDTELHLEGWTSTVPSPGGVMALTVLGLNGRRRRER